MPINLKFSNYLHKKEHKLIFWIFQKNFLIFDFFSNASLTNNIVISSISFSIISSIILNNLSVVLKIIINFSFSKKDLLLIFSINSSTFLIISFSSYFKILSLADGWILFMLILD